MKMRRRRRSMFGLRRPFPARERESVLGPVFPWLCLFVRALGDLMCVRATRKRPTLDTFVGVLCAGKRAGDCSRDTIKHTLPFSLMLHLQSGGLLPNSRALAAAAVSTRQAHCFGLPHFHLARCHLPPLQAAAAAVYLKNVSSIVLSPLGFERHDMRSTYKQLRITYGHNFTYCWKKQACCCCCWCWCWC